MSTTGYREFRSFASLRTKVTYKLYDVAGLIYQRAGVLDIYTTLFDAWYDFKYHSTDLKEPENLQNIGRCFRMRCDLITRTMDEMLVRLGQNPNQQKLDFIGNVTDMLANQVARLSLRGFSGEDASAELMDEQCLSMKQWPTATEKNPDKDELDSIWARLQMVHPVCTCQQCRRRNHHTVPR